MAYFVFGTQSFSLMFIHVLITYLRNHNGCDTAAYYLSFLCHRDTLSCAFLTEITAFVSETLFAFDTTLSVHFPM